MYMWFALCACFVFCLCMLYCCICNGMCVCVSLWFVFLVHIINICISVPLCEHEEYRERLHVSSVVTLIFGNEPKLDLGPQRDSMQATRICFSLNHSAEIQTPGAMTYFLC